MTDKIKEKNIPDIRPGDIVRVYQKIKEGNKEREQAFEGVVMKRSGGNGPAASFIVRKISQGIGVERKFMIFSPFLVKIQVKKRSKVKRADLSYLRNVRQIKRKLKDRKIEPFEESLIQGVKEEEKPTPEAAEETLKDESVKKEKPEEKEEKGEKAKESPKEDKKPEQKDNKNEKEKK